MKLSKKQWFCAGAALLSLTLCGAVTVLTGYLSHLHHAQYAAERWAADGDTDYCQMSAFLTEDAYLTEDSLQSIRESVDASMRAASFDKTEDTRIWYDAYSTQAGQITASGTKRYSAQAQVTAVGGDFFLLHTPKILGGSYLQEGDLMQDRVVLDETLAWQLFGSPDVAGMKVLIGTEYYIVAGVVAREDDYATEKSYGELPRMYISFDLYNEWQAKNESEALIGCYEMVLPDPVRNYAKNAFIKAVGAENNPTMIAMQNTDRNSIAMRWQNLRNLHDMLIVNKDIIYPYWENAARIVDFDLALLLAAQIVLLIYPVLLALRLLLIGWHKLDGFLTQKRYAHKNRIRLLVKDTE